MTATDKRTVADTPIPPERPTPAPDAPKTGGPMDDEPEPGTDPLHEGP
jgi:hypothetical protein